MYLAIHIDIDHLTRPQIPHQLKTLGIEGHTLGGKHIFGTLLGLPLAEHNRANTVGITKTQDTVADNHRHCGIASPATPVDSRNRFKNILLGDA